LKHEEASSPLGLLFKFDFEYATAKVQEKENRLKFNGTHQLLVCANDVYLLRENTNSMNEVYLEVNA
jgi:hypothetical protein